MHEEDELWLVVGLGNPGSSYQGNRHNVGFMVVELLSERTKDLQWKRSERFSCEQAKGHLGRTSVVLVKPQTYMNLSGRSAGPLARFYKVPPERIVTIHDDVDLDLGRLKVKVGGGDGGHNGLRSLSQELGSNDYIRVRFGIGRPERGEVSDYVLANFREEETEQVTKQVKRASGAVTTIMRQGLRVAMNRFNVAPKATAEKTAEKISEKISERTSETTENASDTNDTNDTNDTTNQEHLNNN